MKIQSFIFTWNEYIHNASKLESQLKLLSTTKVINSNLEYTNPSWINVNNLYFAGQWNTLLSNLDTDTDFIFHIQSDASFERFDLIFDRFREISNKYNIGIYAPNVDFTAHTYNLSNFKQYEDKLYFVPNTDCTCWFINKKLVTEIPLFDLNINSIGFGVDWFYIAKSLLNNYNVIRDYKYTIYHPYKTNYNVQTALRQYYDWLETLPVDLKSKIIELMDIRIQSLI